MKIIPTKGRTAATLPVTSRRSSHICPGGYNSLSSTRLSSPLVRRRCCDPGRLLLDSFVASWWPWCTLMMRWTIGIWDLSFSWNATNSPICISSSGKTLVANITSPLWKRGTIQQGLDWAIALLLGALSTSWSQNKRPRLGWQFQTLLSAAEYFVSYKCSFCETLFAACWTFAFVDKCESSMGLCCCTCRWKSAWPVHSLYPYPYWLKPKD